MKAKHYMGWHCAKCGRRVHNPRRTPPRCCKRAMVNDAAKAGQMEMIDVSRPDDSERAFVPGQAR